MAVTSGRVESAVGGSFSKFYVKWQQVSQDTANNTTTINWQAGLYTGTSSSHDFWYSNAVKITNISINGSTASNGGTWSNIKSAGDNQLLTGTAVIPHNSDGSKTFSISISGWLYGSGDKSGSGNFTLNTIPRQTSITNFSVSKRDETSVVYSYSTADACDKAWYSINGGAWTDLPSNNIISGLNPNTTYNFRLKVRRTDSQMTTESDNRSQTTFAIPTQSLKSKTETSITMNWAIDSTANYVWYSKDNGSNWIAVGAVNATSGSYTISGLTAGQTYNIRTRVRRSNGTYYDAGSNNLPVTTESYPYVDTISKSELKIGESQTLTIKNPLSRTVNVYMKKDNTSGTLLYSGSTSGTSITFTPNANTLYNSIPNDNEGNCVYYCVYSNQTTASKTGKYKVDNSQGQQNPTFNLSNWSYEANKTDLTNDNQKVISNLSTITFNIDTPAQAKNSTSIDYYLFEWGTKNIKSTEGNTLTGGDGNIIKVTAIDKRKNSTPTIINLGSNYIDYKSITGSASTERQDGVEANTKMDINGSLFYKTFGENGELNEFISAKYWVSTNNTYAGNGYDINLNNFVYGDNTYKLNDYQIHANGSSGGFTVGLRYNIKIELTDKLSTTIIYTTVTDGKIAADTYQDSNGDYHRGINGLADSNYALKVHGNSDINGNLKIDGKVTYGETGREDYNAGGFIYDQYGNMKHKRNTSTDTFNMQNSEGTSKIKVYVETGNVEIAGQYKGSKGGSWISDRDNAVARNTTGSDDGGYHPVISQKTKNGNWTMGQLSGEDSLSFNYTTDANYGNKTNTSQRCYIPAGTTGNLVDKLRPYPVGSVYISYKATSPASLFGGTWEQLKNHFLFATNATSGDKGGSGNGTGTSTSQNNGNTGSTTLTAAQSGLPSHRHLVSSKAHTYASGSSPKFRAMASSGSSASDYTENSYSDYQGGTNASQGHTHTLNNHSHTIPYIEVYVWRRTA